MRGRGGDYVMGQGIGPFILCYQSKHHLGERGKQCLSDNMRKIQEWSCESCDSPFQDSLAWDHGSCI